MERTGNMTKVRRPAPEWQKRVDQTLWAYSKAKRALSYQETLIKEIKILCMEQEIYLEATGYLERMPSPSKIHSELEKAKERHHLLLDRKNRVEQILNWVFPESSEKRKFVEAYWLTCAGTEVHTRTSLVLAVLPFLGESAGNGMVRGNRNFYYWRDKIYQELAETLGYLPETSETF